MGDFHHNPGMFIKGVFELTFQQISLRHSLDVYFCRKNSFIYKLLHSKKNNKGTVGLVLQKHSFSFNHG